MPDWQAKRGCVWHKDVGWTNREGYLVLVLVCFLLSLLVLLLFTTPFPILIMSVMIFAFASRVLAMTVGDGMIGRSAGRGVFLVIDIFVYLFPVCGVIRGIERRGIRRGYNPFMLEEE